MTISDKIRIYELSRDLNLENKDILDAAQKLSISVKSHSSSISAEEAKKIKNLINKKNSDKKILSIKKPSIKKENYKQNKENESSVISSMKGKPLEDNSKKKPLLIKPLNKPESQKIISNKPINLNKPIITNNSQSQANLTNQNINSKNSQNLKLDKKNFPKNHKHGQKFFFYQKIIKTVKKYFYDQKMFLFCLKSHKNVKKNEKVSHKKKT